MEEQDREAIQRREILGEIMKQLLEQLAEAHRIGDDTLFDLILNQIFYLTSNT